MKGRRQKSGKNAQHAKSLYMLCEPKGEIKLHCQ